jgi:hypothetical protein
MSNDYTFPPAVVLGLWLNAARSGAVSPTDAANAIESITQQIDLESGDHLSEVEGSTWLGLVEVVQSTSEPVAIALPVDGDPAGIPAHILARILRGSGVVAIGSNLLLCQQSNETWVLLTEPHKVIHYDLSQTLRSLTDQITIATKLLSTSDLIGDESEIRNALESFRTLHLPPSLKKRSADALELAARINIIASGAIRSANALHSPSIDRQRVIVLQNLITGSRAVMQSVISFK